MPEVMDSIHITDALLLVDKKMMKKMFEKGGVQLPQACCSPVYFVKLF